MPPTEEVKARHIPLDRLVSVTIQLQNINDRDKPEYAEINLGIVNLLNGYSRGAIRGIVTRELRAQTGHFVYFEIRGIANNIPLDIAYLHYLKSHIKNPAVMVLRRVQKFLMPAHRKILGDLERDQVEARRLDLVGLDVSRRIKFSLETMQRYETMAGLTGSMTRKLDILAKAANAPAQSKWDFQLLRNILFDQHHLRHDTGMSWLQKSTFKGDSEFMERTMSQGEEMLDRKSERIYGMLEKLAKLPFDRDGATPALVDWYGLATRVKRDEDFIRVFDAEEKIYKRLRRTSWFAVQAAYNADKFSEQLGKQLPEPEKSQERLNDLSDLYFEMDRCIEHSTSGEADAAIESDFNNGLLNKREADEARDWVKHNKVHLQSLRLGTFRKIVEMVDMEPELIVAEKLERQIQADKELDEEAVSSESLIPLVPIREMRADLVKLASDLETEPNDLLLKYVTLHDKIMNWIGFLDEMDLHQQIYRGCADFREFEDQLHKLEMIEEQLGNLRRNCAARLVEVFRTAHFRLLPDNIYQTSLELTVGEMLDSLRKLDYSVIEAQVYRTMFEKAIEMLPKDVVPQLDTLFTLLHTIPGQVQLLSALGDWEKDLDEASFNEKQGFIIENEFHLQDLIDDIRAALREKLGADAMSTRRLRFDVFSLADCYAGNLRTLLDALRRRLPLITSPEEGERQLEQVQALENQVIEAQRVTRPDGDAVKRLRELEQANLLSDGFVKKLNQDLVENFAELDQLLEVINDDLRDIRKLQNRFGADHDTDPFELTINLNDYEQLKRIYTFVDNISMMDIKRFGVVYKARNKLMDEVFLKALKNHPDIPRELARLVSRKSYKAYQDSKNVPVDLKIAVLDGIPELMETEAQLLLRTLNFSASDRITSKSIYQALMQILERTRKAKPEQLASIKKIWNIYTDKIKAFKPLNYQQNCRNNVERLLSDARNIIGNRLG